MRPLDEVAQFDEKDEPIVKVIFGDPQATHGVISKVTGIPISTVSKRVARLWRQMVIHPTVDLTRFYPIRALVDVKLVSGQVKNKKLYCNQNELCDFLCKRLMKVPRFNPHLQHVVLNRAMIILGSTARDIQLDVFARDVGALTQFVTRVLHSLRGIASTHTNLIGYETSSASTNLRVGADIRSRKSPGSEAMKPKPRQRAASGEARAERRTA